MITIIKNKQGELELKVALQRSQLKIPMNSNKLNLLSSLDYDAREFLIISCADKEFLFDDEILN